MTEHQTYLGVDFGSEKDVCVEVKLELVNDKIEILSWRKLP